MEEEEDATTTTISKIPIELMVKILGQVSNTTNERCELRGFSRLLRDSISVLFQSRSFNPDIWICLFTDPRILWNQSKQALRHQSEAVMKKYPFPPDVYQNVQFKGFNEIFTKYGEQMYLKKVVLPDLTFCDTTPNAHGLILTSPGKKEAVKFRNTFGKGIKELCFVIINRPDDDKNKIKLEMGNEDALLSQAAKDMPNIVNLILTGEVKADLNSKCIHLRKFNPIPSLEIADLIKFEHCKEMTINRMNFNRPQAQIRELIYFVPNLERLNIITAHEVFKRPIFKINFDQYLCHFPPLKCPIKHLVIEQIHPEDIDFLIRLTNECELQLLSLKISMEGNISMQDHVRFLELLYLQRDNLQNLDICCYSKTANQHLTNPRTFTMSKLNKLRVNLPYLINRLCLGNLFPIMFPELIEVEMTCHPKFDHNFETFCDMFNDARAIESKVTTLKFWTGVLVGAYGVSWSGALGRFFPNLRRLEVELISTFTDRGNNNFIAEMIKSQEFQNNLVHLKLNSFMNDPPWERMIRIDEKLLQRDENFMNILFRKYLNENNMPLHIFYHLDSIDQAKYNAINHIERRIGIAQFKKLESLEISGNLILGPDAIIMGLMRIEAFKELIINGGAETRSYYTTRTARADLSEVLKEKGIKLTRANDPHTREDEEFFKVN